MGEVVPFRALGPGDAVHEAEVRELCRLARIPGEAYSYIRRRTPLPDVLSDCILTVFGKRLPQDEARRFAALCGRAGTARHALQIHPQPHGTRRRPDRPGSA